MRGLLLLHLFVVCSFTALTGTSAVARTTRCTLSGSQAWIVPDAIFTADAFGHPKRYQGKALQKLFARYGVLLSADPSVTSVTIMDDRDVYGAPGTVDNALAWTALGFSPSGAALWHNVIVQSNGNHPASFTLTFVHPVKVIRFIRSGLIAGGQGVSHPEWSAIARTERGRVVATVHELPIAAFSGVPPRSFELTASTPIASVTFAGDNHGFAAFSNLVLQLIGWCR
jgi:hypothetical protein